MAKKNKATKELKNKISYYIVQLRQRGLTLDEFDFYCNELDLALIKYDGDDIEELKLNYELGSAWVIRHRKFSK